MNKLNVGDYVRTKDGCIGKIIDINLGDFQIRYELDNSDEFHYKYKNDIIKSSPDIIDLIEVGDYVNGHRVVEVDLDDIDDYGNTFRYIKTEHDYSLNYWIKENEIETILTKEQFENISYKVGE